MKNALFTTLFALTAFVLLAPLSHAQISLPITFEDAIDYELTDFGGNASSLVADPDDATNTVVQSIRTLGAECFAGTTVANASGFTSPIPFAPGETKMNVRVWSPTAGTPVRFKVEKFNDPTRSVEAEKLTTVAGAWETIVYDFIDDKVPGTADINFTFEYDKASIFFDFSCPGPPSKSEATYYWDDVAFGDVPSDVEASLEAVGSTVVPFTGGSISYAATLTNTTDQPQTVSARIDAIRPNSNPFGPVQGPRTVTLAAGATRGPINFTSSVPGFAPEGTYTLILAVSMGGEVISSDSFTFEKEAPPSSITLPITFEEPIDYELSDFGGNASSLVPDPAGRGGNTVVQSIRTAGAECFAGTLVASASGLAEPVPFAEGQTTMSVRVWSPLVGISVKLKLEKVGGGPTVETDTPTTVANAWETLFFDFSNESPGTPALDFGNEYDIPVIFFNFQCPGPPSTSEEIYFWDDIAFVGGGSLAPQTAASRAVTVDAAYPNPFSSAATIPFEVDAPTEVRLAVYDVMGREVAVLVDGTVETGRHEARFDGQDLASGLYVWKLTTSTQAKTGRLTLVR